MYNELSAIIYIHVSVKMYNELSAIVHIHVLVKCIMN